MKQYADTNLTVHDIESAIVRHHGGCLKVVAVPNVSYGLFRYWGEADLIVLSQRGYATEWEIKRSWADFLNDFKKRREVHFEKCIYNFAFAVPESIGERCKQHLEEKFTAYDMPALYTYSEKGLLSKLPLCGKLHTKKREELGCRRMTEEEQFKLLRLGNIRFWNYQECFPCYRCSYKLKALGGSRKTRVGIFEGEKLIKTYSSWGRAERGWNNLLEKHPDKYYRFEELSDDKPTPEKRYGIFNEIGEMVWCEKEWSEAENYLNILIEKYPDAKYELRQL